MGLKCIPFVVSMASGDVAADQITSLPGFPESNTWGFRAYSGMLDVPGWNGGEYDSLKIHYQFHTSKRQPSSDPVAVWHQGGPGASSITIGLYGEMGAFIIGEDGNYINPYSWNSVANMLYLESPAGSDDFLVQGPNGYSQCIKNGRPTTCRFDDVSQAEAFAHTLTAFFAVFPEYSQNDFYLTGESYFGQFGPNIAHFIFNNEPFKTNIKLKGMAAGNACWGGDATSVQCNGPNDERNNVELFHGKALFSDKLYRKIMENCDFPNTRSGNCEHYLDQMSDEVGPYNVYNIYDNCPNTEQYLQQTGKTMRWLTKSLRDGLHEPGKTRASLLNMSGGFKYDCLGDVGEWIVRDDVKEALHLAGIQPGASQLSYSSSGPASITLYPELAQKMRIMIYNGDADACVPYIGNEEWINDLELQGVLKEESAWAPWFTSNKASPAGYVTKYSVPGSTFDFSFLTVRLAGHMVPQFQPEAGLKLFSSFLQGPSVIV